MDFSKLSSSEKMAVYASVAVIVLAIYALVQRWGGLLAIPLIGAAAVLIIVFLPQMSPNTRLPGSKGSLMLIAGGAAAVFWALGALVEIGYIFEYLIDIDTIIFLIGFAAALWLGFICWRAFQAEGGKFVVGTSGGGPGAASTAPPAAGPPAEPPAAAPPPAAQPPAAAPPPAAPPPEPPMGDTTGGMGSGEEESS